MSTQDSAQLAVTSDNVRPIETSVSMASSTYHTSVSALPYIDKSLMIPVVQNVQALQNSPGVWTQLGLDKESLKSSDDIIQKSLVISGIHEVMTEQSHASKPDSAITPVQDEQRVKLNENSASASSAIVINQGGNDEYCSAGNENENVNVPVMSKCEGCGEQFDDVKALMKHLKTHIEVCPYECASCHALFRLPTHLLKHVKTCKMANLSRPFPCPKCDQAFNKKVALDRHVVLHDESKPRYECDVCKKTFASESYMEKHKRSHAKEVEEEVEAVIEVFPEEGAGEVENSGDVEERGDGTRSLRRRPRRNMAELFESDVDDDVVVPEDDDDDFEEDEDVSADVHVVVVDPQKKKQKSVKKKRDKAATEKRVKLPKERHDVPPKKKYRCGKCDKVFDLHEERIEHVKTHIPGDKEYMCTVCGKSYTMACNLERHMLIHSNVRMHKCDLCGKGFHRVDILDRHRRIHTGEKPHPCNLCSMKFISTSALMVHKKRIHTARPFSCSQCSECFFTSERLKKHMKMHESNRRYTCEKCGKSFINSSNLKTHFRIHTKERPYVCNVCGERFTQKAHVDRHVLIHSKPPKANENVATIRDDILEVRRQLHYCSVCGKSFPKRRGLRMHERMRHGFNKSAGRIKPDRASRPAPENVAIENIPTIQVGTMRIKPDRASRPAPENAAIENIPTIQVGTMQPNGNDDNIIMQPVQPQTWFPPVMHHQQQQSQTHLQLSHGLQQQSVPLPSSQPSTIHHHHHQDQHQQQQHQHLQHHHQQQQPQQQYSVSVFNSNNGSIYTQQYIPQTLNQPYDIQIQHLDEPVVITAADSHDTIMYLIEAAASSNMINQPLQQNHTQEIQILTQQQITDERFEPINTVQFNTGQMIAGQQIQQIQIQTQPPVPPQQAPPKPPKQKRPRVEKNAQGAKPYKCTVCGQAFASSSVLVKHVRTHTGEKPYSCMTCGKAFTQVGNLHRHTKSHQGVRNHRCNICGHSFTRRERLLYHIKVHTGEKNYKCSECGKDFGHKTNLMAHFNRRHSGNKPHKCELCDKAFAEARSLLMHKKTHDSKVWEKKFSCSVCGKRFADEVKLNKHSRVHANIRPHKCTLCQKSYTLATTLRNHMLVQHSTEDEDEPMHCSICNKQFTNKYRLQSHLKTHEARYECDVCGKKFAVSTNLTMHKRIHNGERPFKCEVCSQTFTQRGHLLRHAKICSERKYKCSECFSSFYAWDSLAKHIKKFHGIQNKKHACERCDLHFSSAASLNNHVKQVHLHSCNECGLDFENAKDLEMHKCNPDDSASVHNKENLCGNCGRTFDDKDALLAHNNDCGSSGKGSDRCACPFCDATFKLPALRALHVKRKHRDRNVDEALDPGASSKEKPKPFKCASCDKCFCAISQLKNHMKSHVGERHECSKCKAFFSSKPRLEMHLETCEAATDDCTGTDAKSHDTSLHPDGNIGDPQLVEAQA